MLHPDQATRDPDLQREIEKTANQREAHRICDEPPPPGLTHRLIHISPHPLKINDLLEPACER
ncbi:hypothetical protein RSP822_05810, partial [Ralstonia solanacearum]